MRIIKFRAWNRKWKRIIDNVLVNPDIIIWTFDVDNSTSEWDYLSDDIKVMQFTGLFDKNGKEIYEGDIVSIMDCEPSLYRICYWDNNFKWVVENIGKDPSCWANDNLEEFEGYHLEVIGNIHENPELLEVN